MHMTLAWVRQAAVGRGRSEGKSGEERVRGGGRVSNGVNSTLCFKKNYTLFIFAITVFIRDPIFIIFGKKCNQGNW